MLRIQCSFWGPSRTAPRWNILSFVLRYKETPFSGGNHSWHARQLMFNHLALKFLTVSDMSILPSGEHRGISFSTNAHRRNSSKRLRIQRGPKEAQWEYSAYTRHVAIQKMTAWRQVYAKVSEAQFCHTFHVIWYLNLFSIEVSH